MNSFYLRLVFLSLLITAATMCRAQSLCSTISPQVFTDGFEGAAQANASPEVARSAIGQITTPEVARSAIGQTTTPEVARSAIGQTASRQALARECYVAPSGSDTNPGTASAPFQSVQRCADVAVAGDVCVLRAGTYRETVRPINSGTSALPITYRAALGETVTISGADVVANWQLDSGNVYRSDIALPVAIAANTGFFANQIFANGQMLPQARWPNVSGSYDPMTPPLSNSGASISGSTLTINNNAIPTISGGWNGAVIWGNEWFVSRTAVVNSTSAGALIATVSDHSNWDRAPFWWYLTGARGALDSAGEWHYDSTLQRLFLWPTGAGAPQAIEAKRRNFAFDLSARQFINVQNINLFAATITTDAQSESITLDGINARYVSHYLTLPGLPAANIQPGTDGFALIGAHIHDSGIQLRGRNHRLVNSRISASAGNLVLLEGQGHTVENSILRDANYLASYAAAIQLAGSNHRVLRNSFDRAGRSAINIDWKLTGFSAANLEIAYNDIQRFGLLSTDLGAIYVCCYTDFAGARIHHNVIRNTQGFSPFWGTRGFYFDIEAGFNATLDHNLVYGISNSADNLGASVGTPRGPLRVINNTFVGPVEIGAGVTASNNILRTNSAIGAPTQISNLLSNIDPLFVQPASFDFGLQANSPALNAGTVVPGITDGFIGSAPDIGAFERGLVPWQAGSNLPPN
jgi:hypothetical protein